MTEDHKIGQVKYEKLIRRIFIVLLASGLGFLITSLFGPPSKIWALAVPVFIGASTMIAQFLIDVENRMENLEEKQGARAAEIQSLIKEGFARTNTATALFDAVEASPLSTDTVIRLVRYSTRIVPDSPPLVYAFAQSQIDRISQFLKELSDGGDVCYDGEDRDWILGLTMQSQDTIDAISLDTVDAGGKGFNGGLWTSDHGQRYLELQRDAIHRGVVIRRIFILDSSEQAREPDFLRIYRQQQNLGIHTKILDRSTIPLALKNLQFDFIVFDGVISYESTPAARVEDTKPTIIKTNLALQPERVRERVRRFEDLWAAAQKFERLKISSP